MIVVISGGTNPIPLDKWDDFKPSFPYKKNIDWDGLIFADSKISYIRD